MALRVGCLSYLNALPIALPFLKGHIKSQAEWAYDVPCRLNTMLDRGEIHVALTSSVEALAPPYSYIPSACISAREGVLSVNLYTKVPLHALNGQRIGVTHQSATAATLLKVLCSHLWKITPEFLPLDHSLSDSAAFLLIGDEGLRHQSFPGYTTIDLAAAWFEWKKLPFVFALFAVAEEIDRERINEFMDELQAALSWSHSHQDEIVAEATRRSGLAPELLYRYYSLLKFTLGAEEIKGLHIFKQYVSTIGSRNYPSHVC